MTVFETLFLFFSFLAFLLSLFFFIKKRGDRGSNALLGIYLVLFGYNIVYNVLYWTQSFYDSGLIHLVGTNQLVWVLYGPILYLYVKRVMKRSVFESMDILHFVPPLLIIINWIPFYLLPTAEKIEVVTQYRIREYLHIAIANFVFITIGLQLLYFVLIQVILKKDFHSLNQKNWLNWLSYSYLGYCISFASYFVLLHMGVIRKGHDYFIGFSMTFFIGLVSYFGFLQPQVFDGISVKKLMSFKKYTTTGLTREHSLELKAMLLNYMEETKPYLRSELKLEMLATELNLSRHHMSQVINEHFDAHFFDFINKYRIKEAEKLFRETPHLQVADVLYQCGFNNRVSFNKAFKLKTGITPTQYKKSSKVSSVNV